MKYLRGVCLLFGVAAACSAPDDPAPPPSAAPVAGRSLALLTGDHVTVTSGGRVEIAPAPGRARLSFIKVQDGGHLSVIPSDALPLLHAGRLDPRLFDVTQLLADRYDRLAYVPLIVAHDGRPAARARLGGAARVTRDLASIRAVAVEAPPTGELWRALAASPTALPDGMTKIWLDGTSHPTLDVSVPLIGAPTAWAAGYDGTGVLIAVLDTGIDATHPDLADRVIGEQNFTADDPIFGEDALDHVGHGTHVASTIAGTGAASGGRYRGVAPGAHLLDGKVCSQLVCRDSAILAGMEWAADSGARVVNMSLGRRDTPDLDLLEQAVNTLTAERGVLFVISAGNDGQYSSVNSPGSADAALTVGAFDKSDQLAAFSSRGPRTGDDAMKPELVAPGVNITAARSATASQGAPGALYLTLSGTSMAAPHVTGAAAILAQEHPAFSPAQLKAVLVAAAKPNAAVDGFAQGAGRVDVARAIGQQITTEPAAFSCGLDSYPHGDDAPATRTVTYRNAGAASATLTLALHAVGTDGTAAPAGLFALSAASVTVPAGGTASVDVTCNTTVAGLDGPIGGQLTATAAGVTVQTPFGVNREPESYNLTVIHTDRAGAEPDVFYTYLGRSEADQPERYIPDAATSTLRLPRGHYVVQSDILTDDPLSDTLLLVPPFELTGDRTLALDARAGQPIAVSVPKAEAQRAAAEMDSTYWQPGGLHGFGLGIIAEGDLYSAQLGAPQSVPGYSFDLGEIWARPDVFGGFDNSPYAYSLAWFFEDRLPTGLARHVHAHDVATLRAHSAVEVPGDFGSIGAFALATAADPDIPVEQWFWPIELTIPLPGDHRVFVNTDGGVEWGQWLTEYTPDFTSVAYSFADNAPFAANTTYQQEWNTAVFGPSVAGVGTAVRTGNSIRADVPWFSDGTGRYGLADDASHRISLFANGVAVPASTAEDRFDVAPGLAHYRLEIEYERLLPDLASSEVSGAWTFDSATTATTTPLPLSSISFHPALDDENRAPAGVPFLVPIEVLTQPGSAAGPLHQPTVDVSYDDGATWHAALVLGVPHHRWALLLHPHGPRWVSLRAHAADAHGNSVEETVLRAYQLR